MNDDKVVDLYELIMEKLRSKALLSNFFSACKHNIIFIPQGLSISETDFQPRILLSARMDVFFFLMVAVSVDSHFVKRSLFKCFSGGELSMEKMGMTMVVKIRNEEVRR